MKTYFNFINIKELVVLLSLISSLLFYSCDKERIDIKSSEDIIKLEFESDTTKIRADNNGVIKLKAVIDPKSSEEFRNVTFNCSETLGSFTGTDPVVNNTQTVKVNEQGIATTNIKVSATPGIYYVSAEVKVGSKVYKTQDYSFLVKPIASAEQMITLEFESDTTGIKADNISLLKIKATIPANAVNLFRNITFNATPGLGTFSGTNLVTNNSQTIKVGDDGIARTSIKVGSIAGAYYISAETKNGETVYKSKEAKIALRQGIIPEKLILSSSSEQLKADGFTILTISATAKNNEKTAKLTTNLGTFINSTTPRETTLSFDNNGNASALFKISNEALPHILTGSFSQGAPTIITITPELSRPEIILVETDALSIDTIGGSILVTTYLKRANVNEKVSKNYIAEFTAYQMIAENRITVGRFSGINEAVSDENGKIPSIKFFADTGTIDKNQNIIIEVSTSKSLTERIIKVLQLKIK